MTKVRPFQPADAAACAQLYHESVHGGTQAHYDAAQRAAWSPAIPEREVWLARIAPQQAWVAEGPEGLRGFMTLTTSGLVDLAFVRPDLIGQGVGKALFARLLDAARAAGLTVLETDASDAAKPFFESLGFTALRRNRMDLQGVTLENTTMRLRVGL
ncbi:MAG: GNAT family N-acetyltransferase [Pseudomonadota bacterium]